MDEITTLTTLDYVGIVSSGVAAIAAIKSLLALFEWAGKKLGIKFKWVEQKKADHALLEKTAESLGKIEKRIDNDEKVYTAKDETFDREIEKISDEISGLKDMSADILNKLKSMCDTNEMQKQAINEVLFDVIDKQCDRYINELHGIPASEVAWFSDRFKLYDRNGGNHGLKRKVNYCFDKLPIIPD